MNDAGTNKTAEAGTISVIRSILLIVLVLGMLGTAAELLLIGHTEGLKQWVPLFLILVSLSVVAWHAAAGGSLSIRLLQALMITFIGAGVVGFYLHYRGSVEFRLESNPSLQGWALFWGAIRGKAPPPLAPGIMIELGLTGLAYAYRHPASASATTNESDKKGE